MSEKEKLSQELPLETLKMLWRIFLMSNHPQVRQRAHCILLMEKGYKVSQLVEIFCVSRKTIYNWKNNWLNSGLVGLYNRPGRGRKEIFKTEQKEEIKTWAKINPKNLKKVIEKAEKKWGITPSKDTIKRILKCCGLRWKRIRRVVGGKPDPEVYSRKKKILKVLQKLSEQGSIDLRYLDETGFCLTPYVPYAWQEKGQELELESRQSKRLNLIGLLNRNNELESYIFNGSITSKVVIELLDKFCQKIKKLTVVVMDNAPIHTSKALKEKIEQWRKKKLEIFWLPTYSPHLNLIEILWRFMKYEWIEIDAYSSWETLVEYVEKVLKGFGDRYVINFA